MLYQDINAWTEGREAPCAAYSSNKYTRRDSRRRTFHHLYRSVPGQVKLGVTEGAEGAEGTEGTGRDQRGDTERVGQAYTLKNGSPLYRMV